MSNELQEEITGDKQKNVQTPMSFEPPAVDVLLPSKGILYDNPDIKKNGYLKIRPMTLNEEELFIRPDLLQSGTTIDAVFSRCIKSDINPLDLLSGDRNFLLYYLRSISYGDSYQFEHTCSNENCKSLLDHTVNLGDLPITFLKKGTKEPFEVTLPTTKAVIKYRLARGFDEQAKSARSEEDDLEESLNNAKSSVFYDEKTGKTILKNSSNTIEDSPTKVSKNKSNNQQGLTDSLLGLIISIEFNGQKLDKKQYREFVSNLIGRDASLLRKAIDEEGCGVETKVTIACPVCGNKDEVGVPFSENFFRGDI